MTKIMLVEDDKSLREIYGIRLIAEGYDIKSAGDGEEALAMAIKERPDLIISDVMMPKISGFDMLDILRATPETKDIKVIMMTALSSEDQRTRGESLGADRYLVKSQVGIEDVVRTVHDVLADAPNAAPTAPAFGPLVPSSNMSTPAPSTAPVPNSPAPQPPTAPAATDPNAMPQPTAPFSSPAPASLGDNMVKQSQPDVSVSQEQPAVETQTVIVDETPITTPIAPISIPVSSPNAPQPQAVSQTTPQPANPTPTYQPTQAPIQDVVPPQPQTSPQPAQPNEQNIADMIARELGGQQQTPPQNQ